MPQLVVISKEDIELETFGEILDYGILLSIAMAIDGEANKVGDDKETELESLNPSVDSRVGRGYNEREEQDHGKN